MSAYVVTIPDLGGQTLLEGANRAVVFAASPTDAIAVAKSYSGIDTDTAWGAATATEITDSADFSDYVLICQILDSTPVVDLTVPATGLSVLTVAINDGGTGYSVNDIITLTTGTIVRAATFRVTAETGGVIDAVELVDPGEYTAAPDTTGVATTGGNGDATVDVTSGTDQFECMCAAAVGLLNAESIIAGAAIDMGAGPPLLTVAAAGDSLGDKAIVVEFRKNGVAIPSLVGTVTDEGASGAALTAALAATQVPGKVVETMKG